MWFYITSTTTTTRKYICISHHGTAIFYSAVYNRNWSKTKRG